MQVLSEIQNLDGMDLTERIELLKYGVKRATLACLTPECLITDNTRQSGKNGGTGI